ncbi:unnamed protein product [Rhizophagus irregularis]|nr:unnamed protein product [Rhizophagus irregularis]
MEFDVDRTIQEQPQPITDEKLRILHSSPALKKLWNQFITDSEAKLLRTQVYDLLQEIRPMLALKWITLDVNPNSEVLFRNKTKAKL